MPGCCFCRAWVSRSPASASLAVGSVICPGAALLHSAISKAQPVAFELPLGWLIHYLIGIAYAGLLLAVLGIAWLEQPTYLPALAFGAATVAAPWFVMQPAMGAGFAATKTPTPLKNCLRSLANHAVFGTGLYLAAAALDMVMS